MKWIAKENILLFDALALMAPDSSKTTLRSWLQDGRVSIDGNIEKNGKTLLKPGQTLSLGSKPQYLPLGIQVLYQDNDIVIIDKPEGVLSVATDFEKKMTAHAILKNELRPRKVFVVHRLDQDTSGVMMFALNEKAQEVLKADFETHTIERCYVAIVEGNVEEAQGTWQSYLYEDQNYVVHSTPIENKGALAITHYKVMGKSCQHSWLDLKLETGKKNQIRVHCQDAGYSVVGDKKYGAETDPLKRLCLHAYLLTFKHPITKKRMKFMSPIPEKFDKLVKINKKRMKNA